MLASVQRWNGYADWDLLITWTARIVRARYQQSLLGGAWAILQPVAQVAILTVIFTRLVPVETDGIPYIVFAYTAMLPWILFSTSLADMVNSLVENLSLLTKIYFARETLVIAACVARLLDFAIAALVLLALMFFYHVSVNPAALIVVPTALFAQVSLALGLGFFGASVNVFFRDVKHLILLVLQLWLYVSPVIYPASRVPTSWQALYFLNPMAGVLTAYRDVLLYDRVPGLYLLSSAAMSIAALVLGYAFLKRVEFRFADVA